MPTDPSVARGTTSILVSAPNFTDVFFRLGAATFGAWVVTTVATAPASAHRPAWWTVFLLLGALAATVMLIGAFMTLNLYLHRASLRPRRASLHQRRSRADLNLGHGTPTAGSLARGITSARSLRP